MSASTTPSHARRLDASARLTRVLAVVLGLHGFAHFAGTSDSWSKAADGRSFDYVAGAWTLSDPALLRAFGVIWALLGVAFIAAGVVTWMRRPAWPRVLAIVSVASLVVVSVALWSSVTGVIVDVALIALAVRAGAFSHAGARR